jgi:hypothetical protein
MFPRFLQAGAALLLLACTIALHADDKTPAAPDFSKGMLCGKVVDAATGKPVPDATVALQDKDGKVIAWTKTDATGKYCLAAESLKVLNLLPSHRRGLLDEIARGVGQVVTAPIKVAGGVVEGVKKTNPVDVVKNAAISTATGNPVPIATQAITTVTGGTASSVDAAKTNAVTQTKEGAVRSAFGERMSDKQSKKPALAPGEVFLSVSRPEYKEIRGKAGAYWLDAPIPPNRQKKDDKGCGVCAWMETVKLAPAAAADKKSEIANEAIVLSDPKAEPALIPAGSTCKLTVKLQSPMDPASKVRVFARENKKKSVVELQRQANGIYVGELPIDPKCPNGNTKISIAALREEPIEVKLPKSKEDPLTQFAKRLDDLDPDKPYDFDPKILASENRLDLTITVLDPKQQTPSNAPSPAAPAKPTDDKKK